MHLLVESVKDPLPLYGGIASPGSSKSAANTVAGQATILKSIQTQLQVPSHHGLSLSSAIPIEAEAEGEAEQGEGALRGQEGRERERERARGESERREGARGSERRAGGREREAEGGRGESGEGVRERRAEVSGSREESQSRSEERGVVSIEELRESGGEGVSDRERSCEGGGEQVRGEKVCSKRQGLGDGDDWADPLGLNSLAFGDGAEGHQGGQLPSRGFYASWRSIGTLWPRWISPFYRALLTDGFKIQWQSLPPPDFDKGEFEPGSPQETLLVQQELDSLLQKRAVEKADSSGGHIYRWFLVSKKDTTSKRPVLNMKPGNVFVKYKHFKLEDLKTARDLAQEGDWAVRVDLKDAYLHVPVALTDRRYFRFRHLGKIYQWRTLPFGYRDAPRFFQKMMIEALRPLRELGIRLVIYLVFLFSPIRRRSVASIYTWS